MTARSHLLRPVGVRVAGIVVLTVALLVTSLWATRWPVPAVVSLSPSRAAAQAAPSGPTGGFAMHGGIGGQIDPRTGQFSVTVPLTTVTRDGQASVSVALDWQQERALTTPDRSGWGAGWSIGSSYVDVAGTHRVYPASGGSYALDPSEPSGLKHYKLQDLKFTSAAGILPRRPGADQVTYSYALTYDDGRADYFDKNGNLAARVDRFGNRTDIAWIARANNVWQPKWMIDSNGLKTTFDYSTPGQVKVVSPARSDGVQPTTTIAVSSNQGVQSVTDPVGNKTGFTYTQVSGQQKPLITLITTATGARTAVTYQQLAYSPGLVASSLKETDLAGNAFSPVQTFNINPSGNNQHNFTGYPNHLPTPDEPDALFESGDTNYTYTTALTTGATTTLSTYDALHRLIRKQIAVTPAIGQNPIVAQAHTVSYPTPVRQPALLPANYGHPTQVSLTESAATSPDGLTASAPRTTSTSTSYDDHGRVVSATDELGTVTTTAYDDDDKGFGLVIRQTTTGADGTQAQMVNTLTADRANIATSTTSVGTDGGTLSARQTLSYEYDHDGQLTKRTLGWAPGAEPDADEPGGGPDEIVTTFERSLDLAGGTQSVTTTVAAGSPAAQVTTTTIDLVSGQPVSHADALGRTTKFEYDALGRQTTVTTPGGMVTTTAYTPTQTTVTRPDGRVTRKTVDPRGRTVSVTDNVRNGALVADPAARTLSTHVYSHDGSSMTSTDQTGRTTTTVLDAFGRTVSQDAAIGLTHLKSYDDGAAHTMVAELVPDGAAQPNMSTTTSYDDADRAIHEQTTYAAGSGGTIADPVSAKEFDGLGQPTTTTGNDLEVTNDLSGPGGIAKSSTAAPQSTDEFPGEPMTAVTTHALAGQATSRTLHQGDEVSSAVTVEYDAAGNLVSAIDPEGRATTYTYTPDGQPLTKTSLSGTVTTHSYDSTSSLLSGITVTAPGKPTRAITYTRVPAGQPGAGLVATVSDGTDTISYGYDVDGHRTSVTYPDGTSTSADYNDKGQLVTTTDVTGAVTSYVYGADGTLTSATQRRGTTVLASVSYAYDAMSRIATTTRGNGTVTTNTYTDQNQLATQTTKDASGRVLEAHSYTYDAHYNPATRTDTYPPGGSATPTGGTWTTVYSYDAYDRLLGSAVYAGPLTNGQPVGLPITTTRYSVDLGGDVVTTTKTTRVGGIRPITSKTTSTNTIDDSGRLIAQKTGATTATQTFDDDGRVLTSLDGVATTYLTDGSPGSTTLPDGTTSSYTLWPDGTRRSATTTNPGGAGSSTITYHYGVDGVHVNDSTSDASTPTGTTATASYLVTAGREARTLLPGTATTGKVTGTPGTPIDTGTGVGYYLRDRHTSVSGLTDDTGTVTATYAYTDYGTPARADGRRVNQGTYDGGRTNPYTYLGASPRGPLAEAGTGGLLAFADRTYDPQQGRFTSPDPVDAHNRYQAFSTNPITYLDLSGQISVVDIALEVVFAVVAAVSIVITGGAAIPGVVAVAAGEATAAMVVSTVAAVTATVASAAGMATNVMLAAGDIDAKIKGKDEWDDKEFRDRLVVAANVSAAVAGVAGGIEGVANIAAGVGHAAEAAGEAAAAADDDIGDLRSWTEVTGDPPPLPSRANKPQLVPVQQQVVVENAPPRAAEPEALDNADQQPPNQVDQNPNHEIVENQNQNQNELENPGQIVVDRALAGQEHVPLPDQNALQENPEVFNALKGSQGAEVFKPKEVEGEKPSPGTSDAKTLDPILEEKVQPIMPVTMVNHPLLSAFENWNVILDRAPAARLVGG